MITRNLDFKLLLAVFLVVTQGVVLLNYPITVDNGSANPPLVTPTAPPTNTTISTDCVETQFANGTHHYCVGLTENIHFTWTLTTVKFDARKAYTQFLADTLHRIGELVENFIDAVIPLVIISLIFLLAGILSYLLRKTVPIPLVFLMAWALSIGRGRISPTKFDLTWPTRSRPHEG